MESDISSPPLQPAAQAWVNAITAAVAKLRSPVTLSPSAEPLSSSSALPGSELLRRLLPAPGLRLGSAHPTARQALGPPLPEPSSFLHAGETLVLSGPVAKQGPFTLSLFKPRLLVLTQRRLLYFSANPSDKRGVMVLTPDAVAGVTHQGKRFEVSAYPLGEQQALLRRYYFEVDPGAEPTAQRWVEAIAKAVSELWSPADASASTSSAQKRSVAAPLVGSPGAVTPQKSNSNKRGGGDDGDELPFEAQLQAFISDLERFLGAAKPALDVLEADAHAMGAACEAVSVRFNCHDDDDSPTSTHKASVSGSQAAFVGLVRFANLLAKARFKWEADHGRGLAEVYTKTSHGADDDTDEDDEGPLIERLAHYIAIGVTFEQVAGCTPGTPAACVCCCHSCLC
jgi:cytochrome c556